MEVKIGIQNVQRELTLDLDLSTDQVNESYSEALSSNGLLTLTDISGRTFIIPASSIGYIEFSKEHSHPVGFGTT